MEKCKDIQKSMSKMNLCGPVTRLQQASALGQCCFVYTQTPPLSIHYFEANTAHYLILLKKYLIMYPNLQLKNLTDAPSFK